MAQDLTKAIAAVSHGHGFKGILRPRLLPSALDGGTSVEGGKGSLEFVRHQKDLHAQNQL